MDHFLGLVYQRVFFRPTQIATTNRNNPLIIRPTGHKKASDGSLQHTKQVKDTETYAKGGKKNRSVYNSSQ